MTEPKSEVDVLIAIAFIWFAIGIEALMITDLCKYTMYSFDWWVVAVLVFCITVLIVAALNDLFQSMGLIGVKKE